MERHVNRYSSFLDRATSTLAQLGELQMPLPPCSAEWHRDWDRFLASNEPGSRTMYAFTRADGVRLEELRERVERLAAGLARTRVLAGGLHLVAVLVYAAGIDSGERRRATRIAPATFFQGLRPATWVVDLTEGRVYSGRFIRSEGSRLIEAVIADDDVHSPDPEVLEAARQRQLANADAFYQLMRGRQPYATFGLIAVNVVLFWLLSANGGADNPGTLRDFGALSPSLVESGQCWRAFTSIFLHASIPHILFNMTSLFAVGTLAERLYGSVKFLAIYLGSGLIGSGVSLGFAFVTGHLDVLGVGASGAIFGVAGALLTVRFQTSDVIPRRLRERVSLSLLPLVALSLLFAFLTPYVDNGAHVGGLFGGVALSFVFPLTRQAPEVAQ